MGSDDGAKAFQRYNLTRSTEAPKQRYKLGLQDIINGVYCTLRWAKLALPCVLCLVLYLWIWGLPAPEVVTTETFRAHDILDAVDSNNVRALRRYHFPPRCVNRLREIIHLNDKCLPEVAEHQVVFACHRKWCQSWIGGFCESIGGLGDRTRFLLSQVEDVLSWYTQAGICKARISLDYTTKDLALQDSLVYKDPAGWWGELLHYRSYDISERRPLQVVLDGARVRRNHANKTALELMKQTSRRENNKPMISLFSHFVPYPPGDRMVDYKGELYKIQEFDPCTFHSLFQPGVALQRDLNRHNRNIDGYSSQRQGHTTTPTSIGIHFRTGDAKAFGLTNKDQRVSSMDAGWLKMMDCAKELADHLFPETPWEDVSLFLATDNLELKKQQQQQQQRQQESRPSVYTTEVAPSSYLRGLKGDRDAWLELYLLSARQGLVVNVRPEYNYTGLANRLSLFSVLAKKIGFMEDDHVMECVL